MHLPAESALLVGSDRSEHARVARGLIGRVDLRHRSWGEDEVARAYRDAIGDRPDGAEEAGGRGAPDRGRSDGHTRDTPRGDTDGSNRKPNPPARDVSHHRDRRG
jgi:hypothetical protein